MSKQSAHIGGSMPDAIRGGAAAMVAVAHCWQAFLYPLSGDWWPFQVLGSLAAWSVATFFLLSGILIARSIKGRSESGAFHFKSYIMARLLRIYPPLVAAVVITIGAVLIIRGFHLYGSESYLLPGDVAAGRKNATIYWPDLLSTLLLTYNLWQPPSWLSMNSYLFFNGPLWSLSYEFWMYVIAGLFCIVALPTRQLYRGIAAILALGLIYQMLCRAPVAQMHFLTVGAVWGAGFGVGWFWSRVEKTPRWVILLIASGFILLAMKIAGAQLPSYLISPYLGEHHETAREFFYIAVSGALLCCIIMLIRASDQSSLVAKLARIGGFSYTLYLIHFPLMMLSLSLFRPLAMRFGVWGQVVLAVATFLTVLWIAAQVGRIAENRPLLRSIGRHLIRKERAQRIA